ncbi:hypothetical protein ACFYXH_22745 [Streptomyces sp. NPDC002730]|uniref:hypothetical protein n=1 Tax=Streptomyces sp. NPDC002730 TaxID=3364662 RepID=UPI0036AF21F8
MADVPVDGRRAVVRVRVRRLVCPTRGHVRGVSHDTRELTESAARSSRRDTSTGSGLTFPHLKSLVNAAASRSQLLPLIRAGFSGAVHLQCR